MSLSLSLQKSIDYAEKLQKTDNLEMIIQENKDILAKLDEFSTKWSDEFSNIQAKPHNKAIPNITLKRFKTICWKTISY